MSIWILVVSASACSARTPLADLDSHDGPLACPDAGADAEAGLCGCAPGFALAYDATAGCSAPPRCVPLQIGCTTGGPVPSLACTCGSHQPILLTCVHGNNSVVPVTGELSCLPPPQGSGFACDPASGPLGRYVSGQPECGDDQICGHRCGASTFECCDPSRECGACGE